MPEKEKNNLSLILTLLAIAAGQAIIVNAFNNETAVDISTNVLTKTSLNITDFSYDVDGRVVDFF